MTAPMTDLEQAAFLTYCAEAQGTTEYNTRLIGHQDAFIAGMRATA
jgi:hypothetical protein